MILVTGGTGLIGTKLISHLLVDRSIKIKAIYRKTYPTKLEDENIEWIKSDILNPESLNRAFKNIEYVYHCAAFISFQPKEVEKMIETNQIGTRNIVNKSIEFGVKKIIHLSSVSALGNINSNMPINESMHWNETEKLNSYGKSKYLSEIEIQKGSILGLNYIIVNPSIVLGFGDFSRRGSHEIFKTAMNSFPFYTNGTCGFVYVEDLIKSMIILMSSNIKNDNFIINGYNLSFKALYQIICKEFKTKPPRIKIGRNLSSLIWRIEYLISKLKTNYEVHLSKETAFTSQQKIKYDNQKFINLFKDFEYTNIHEAINIICNEYLSYEK
jgi:dihydroflavonol-4-reductase